MKFNTNLSNHAVLVENILTNSEIEQVLALRKCVFDNYPESVGEIELITPGSNYTINTTILTGYFNFIYKSMFKRLKVSLDKVAEAAGWSERLTLLGLKTVHVEYFPVGGELL